MLAMPAVRPLYRFLLAIVFAFASAGAARAQIGSERYSSIVIDSATGNVLSAANPDELRFPASLTKMMTLYMLFEAVRDHRIALNQYVPISENAASMSPTKLGLRPSSLITVEECILGLVTKSANDAAAALGELMGGDEDRFAQMMTLRAHALGMTHTVFRNASGLPDWNQVTTARDMAVLARHLLQDFPNEYRYFSTPYFVYAGHMIRSHQAMLATYAGADGLKTGYTEASGFNVVTSAIRSDVRLIGVVIGANNSSERNAHMAMLLDQGFAHMGVAPMLTARRAPPALALIERDEPVRVSVRDSPRMSRSLPARIVEPRIVEPRIVEPRGAEPRGVEPRGAGSRLVEPRGRSIPALHVHPAAQAQPIHPTRTAHGVPPGRYPG